MAPSTVSIVDPNEMVELKRIETGVMPHGSRISPDGRWHYSLAMMSGELYEIDALQMQLNRALNLDLAAGYLTEEELKEIKKEETKHEGHEGHENMYHSTVKPTWVIPHPAQRKVYVAGNGSDEILEVDLDRWTVTRRFKTGKGPRTRHGGCHQFGRVEKSGFYGNRQAGRRYSFLEDGGWK